MTERDEADWPGYRRLVLDSLKRIDDNVKGLHEKLNDHDREIAMLQVKSGVWGAAAGLLVVLAAYFMKIPH